MKEGRSYMGQEERDLELVSDYLYDRLNDMERLAFERRLREDESFKVFYEEIKLMIKGIGSYGRRENLQKVQLLEEVLSKGSEDLPRSGSRKLFYWMAAAVFALVVVSSVFLLQPSRPSALALFESYYDPYPNVFEPIERGAEEEHPSLKKKAFIAYENSRFNEASGFFETLLSTTDETGRDIALLYLGICYIELGQELEALDCLGKIGEKGVLHNQGQWYMALVFMKRNETDNAKMILEELEKTGESYYSGRAQEILDQLNQ